MAIKKRKKDFIEKNNFKNSIRKDIKQETLHAVFAIIFFVLAILSMLAAFDKAGKVGTFIYTFLEQWFGFGYFLIPVSFIMIAISFIKGIERKFNKVKIIGIFLFFFSGLGFIDLLVAGEGGIIGHWISSPLRSLIDVYATAILLVSFIAIAIIIVLEIQITPEHLKFWKWFKKKILIQVNLMKKLV